jgi:hypothetical protein
VGVNAGSSVFVRFCPSFSSLGGCHVTWRNIRDLVVDDGAMSSDHTTGRVEKQSLAEAIQAVRCAQPARVMYVCLIAPVDWQDFIGSHRIAYQRRCSGVGSDRHIVM